MHCGYFLNQNNLGLEKPFGQVVRESREIATYCEGTDTRTSVEEVYRHEVFREPRHEVTRGRPYERGFEFEIPPDAMPSFKAAHNEVRWSLEARAAPIRWPRFERRFLICVYPAPVACEVTDELLVESGSSSAGGYSKAD